MGKGKDALNEDSDIYYYEDNYNENDNTKSFNHSTPKMTSKEDKNIYEISSNEETHNDDSEADIKRVENIQDISFMKQINYKANEVDSKSLLSEAPKPVIMPMLWLL